MDLLIDAGNTRLKWYHSDSGSGSVLDSGWLSYQSVPSLFDVNEQHVNQSFDRILVSNVRGDAFAEMLTRLCVEKCNSVPLFARVKTCYGGLTVGYEQPDRLGVDRWLAMLAVFARVRQACVVVDAGTAITADYVSAEGRHLGGLIIPGVQTMAQSLLLKTRNVDVAALTLPQNWQPGCDTVSCVEQGVATAIKGFLQQVVAHTKMLGERDSEWRSATIYLTGGDAQILRDWMPPSTCTESTLIPEGLLLAFDNNNRN